MWTAAGCCAGGTRKLPFRGTPETLYHNRDGDGSGQDAAISTRSCSWESTHSCAHLQSERRKFRPPFAPITMGLYAGRRTGRRYRVALRRVARRDVAERRRAVFEDMAGGGVLPPIARRGISGDGGESRGRPRRERQPVSSTDHRWASLEFRAGCSAFLDLMYVGTMSTTVRGQARYGVLQ